MTSSHHDDNTRRHREYGSGTKKKQQEHKQQMRTTSSSKDKTKHHASSCSRGAHTSKRECDCVNTSSRNVPHRRKSVRHIPHEYTPFHHLSLDVMDGLPDDDELEFGTDPEYGQHDYIGDESTTILTPSYDSTTSTVSAYLAEIDEHATYFDTPNSYSHTTHDLQYIGHWIETQEANDKERELLPDYRSAMNIGHRYATRTDVRRVMVETEIAFPSIKIDINTYETGRQQR